MVTPSPRPVTRTLTGLTLWLLASAATAEPSCTLAPFEATYDSEGFGMQLTIHRSLQPQDDGTWLAGMQASKLFFTVEEHSRFALDGGTVIPREYHYARTAGGDRNQDWVFDHDAGEVSNRHPAEPWTLPLEPGAQDKLSYQIQISLDLACREDDWQTVTYPVPDEDNYDRYRWTVRGRETVNTPLGDIPTVKLERLRGHKKREDFIWLAPDWNYMLVKQRHVEKGETTDTVLRELRRDGKPVTTTP